MHIATLHATPYFKERCLIRSDILRCLRTRKVYSKIIYIKIICTKVHMFWSLACLYI